MNFLSASAEVREAFQLRLLLELMGNAVSKELVLKGGLALRMVHGSTRYTKDIDLDADASFPKERIQGIARRAITKALTSGLIDNAKVSEPKQTDTTLRWKIAGQVPGRGAPLHLTVEISRRAPSVPSEVIEVPIRGRTTAPAVQVRSMNRRTLAANKVLALTDPRRFAVRDLYDLHVLIDAQVESPAGQLAVVAEGHGRIVMALSELWPKIESMTWNQFCNDVAPFLPASLPHGLDEEAFEELRVKVGTRVEAWLKQAAKGVSEEGET